MTFQQRVIDEKIELDDKIEKLTKFINDSHTYTSLPLLDKVLLYNQKIVMEEYSSILQLRMERDFDENIPDQLEELRMYCLVRGDLAIPLGKWMVQASHAFMGAFNTNTNRLDCAEYFQNSQPKIVLKAKNEAMLIRAEKECLDANINCYLVTDIGRTVFNEPTVTCLGIGPVLKKDLPKFINKLQLF